MSNVLVVDDNDEIRSLLRETLEDQGYSVCEAADGEAALRLLGQLPADLIILDILMPGKEGLETIVEIRRQKNPAKIIAMSGTEQHLKVAKLLGADFTLRKPFNFESLSDLVKEVLSDRPNV